MARKAMERKSASECFVSCSTAEIVAASSVFKLLEQSNCQPLPFLRIICEAANDIRNPVFGHG